MPNKQMKKIVNLNKDELLSKIRETENSLFENRMKLKTGQLENVAIIWSERKDLARMKGRYVSLMREGSGKEQPR